MKFGTRGCVSALLIISAFALIPAVRLFAQQDKVAALKQSLGENKEKLRQYKWVETTAVSLKGEEKARTQKLCFYGPDGKVQKQEISAPAPQQSPGGVKGKVVAKKKGEMTEYMKQAVGLVHQYLPPDPQRIQAVKAAGGLSVSPTGPGAVRVDLRNYLKNGDSLGLNLDTASNLIQTINVSSYLESEKDAITMSITFARLGDGVSYPATILLNAPEKKLQVKIQNSNYEPVAPQAAAPQPTSTRAPASPQAAAAIDQLTAPIALYPDALIYQILEASTNVDTIKSFAGWMGKNTNLKGSELQDAAEKAGFGTALVALAPFPQVIQMMIQKPDWTEQLGQAFTADKNAVSDSIQRLRAQAQAAGNLKTTSQQQVETQTTSGGQQVIVIQPANPQVIYVPTYNPQTVYVAAPPPPSGASVAGAAAIGFTMGVIIGASHNSYYHARNEYWDHREDYYEDRQQNYQQNQDQRQSNAQSNQSQRQSTAQSNQSQRQSTAQGNQSERQSTAQGNQSERQSTASSAQSKTSGSQAQRQSGAASAQPQGAASQSQRQTAAATSSRGSGQSASQRSGMSSGGFSGYQSGSTTKAQSSRGGGSVSSSRGGGGGGRSRSGGGRSR